MDPPAVVKVNDDIRWKICVYRADYIYWAIALSHLFNESGRDEETSIQNIQCILKGDNASINIKDLLESFKKYNPFLNRYTCFYNKQLKIFVNVIKSAITEFVKNQNTQQIFSKCDGKGEKLDLLYSSYLPKEEVLNIIIEAACVVLNSSVAVYQYMISDAINLDPHLETYRYPHNQEIPNSTNPQNVRKEIMLLREDEDSESWKNVYICLTYDTGVCFQKQAFAKIIRDIPSHEKKHVDILYALSINQSNYLAGLMEYNGEDIQIHNFIRNLLQYHPYILSKLNDAGFVTDPLKTFTSTDIENSVFYIAFRNGLRDILFLVYNYSIHASFPLENTARAPTACVIDNLKQLTNVLKDTQKKYQELFKIESPQHDQIQELIEYHSFLRKICESLFNIEQRNNFNDNIADEYFLTLKCKDAVEAIIHEYSEYFNMKFVVLTKQLQQVELFDHYKKHIHFFQYLDMQSALYFFDNFFALQKKLNNEGSTLKAFESTFVRFLFHSDLYSNASKNIGSYKKWKRTSSSLSLESPSCSNTMDSQTNKIFHLIQYLERSEFEKDLKSFLFFLKNLQLTEKSITESVDIIYPLEDEPLIKDEIIIRRLSHYLTQALDVNLDNDQLVGVFAIERCLQVIGESINLSNAEKPTVINSLLSSTFNEIQRTDVKKIRDDLSHYRKSSIISRLEAEANINYFNVLRNDLEKMRKIFSHIFELQKHRMEIYFIKRCIDKLKRWESGFADFDEAVIRVNIFLELDSGKSVEVKHDTDLYRNKKKLEKDLKYCYNVLMKKLDNANQELKSLSLKLIKTFDTHFDNHFSIIEENYKRTKHLVPTHQDDIDNDSISKASLQSSKEEKIQNLTDRLMSIKLLMEFIINETRYNIPKKKTFLNEVKSVIVNTNFNELGTQIQILKDVKNCVFAVIRQNTRIATFEIRNSEFVCSPQLLKPFPLLNNDRKVLSDNDKELLISSIPEMYSQIHQVKNKLLRSLQNKEFLTDVEIETELEKLKSCKMESKCLKRIKRLYFKYDIYGFDTNFIDYVQKLKKSLSEEKIHLKHFKTISSKFGYDSHLQSKLETLLQDCPKLSEDKRLEFFYGRIKTLKTLLIDNTPRIKYLWDNVKNARAKKYTQFLIVRNYVERPMLQAAVEQLLFDCIVLLKENHLKLNQLWCKITYMFSGLNLRNLLAHGNSIIESVNCLVDPYDLPNEIVTKTLKLIANLDAIEAMVQLRSETGMNFAEFQNEVENDKTDEFQDLRQRIKRCKQWKHYTYLIPEMSNGKETLSSPTMIKEVDKVKKEEDEEIKKEEEEGEKKKKEEQEKRKKKEEKERKKKKKEREKKGEAAENGGILN